MEDQEQERLEKLIKENAEGLEDAVDRFRKDMTSLLNDAKNNEILSEIKALNRRLGFIEARLDEKDREE